jgi:hypothetical protein
MVNLVLTPGFTWSSTNGSSVSVAILDRSLRVLSRPFLEPRDGSEALPSAPNPAKLRVDMDPEVLLATADRYSRLSGREGDARDVLLLLCQTDTPARLSPA